MRCNKIRVISLLGFLVIVLVSLNVFLLSTLNSFSEERYLIRLKNLLEKEPDFKQLPTDSSDQYKIDVNFLLAKTELLKEELDVTLVTHCTSNHLHYLLDLTEHWKGPISLAVFIPGYDVVTSFTSLLGLYECHEAFRDRVTIHLVYPLSHPPAENTLQPYWKQALNQQGTCQEFLARLKSNVIAGEYGRNYANFKVPYPNNLLRNVGRSILPSESYVFVVDVDMMCNGNLYFSFLDYAQHINLMANKGKRVFVVASFESVRKLSPSLTKKELIALWDSGSVQPFYYQTCWKCQKHLDYDAWKSYHSSDNNLQIAYSVDWKDPWEPFYIAPNHVPLYDERFKQYGFNRISQVCETHTAGYDFVVLNNAFLIHHGFKIREGFHSAKDEENNRNRELFRTFKKELKLKYPQSTSHC